MAMTNGNAQKNTDNELLSITIVAAVVLSTAPPPPHSQELEHQDVDLRWNKRTCGPQNLSHEVGQNLRVLTATLCTSRTLQHGDFQQQSRT